MAMDALRNPLDPLHNTGPEAEKELFRRMSQVAVGFPLQTVAGAAMNVVLNTLRQSFAKRETAESKFNELVTKTREVLLEKHYDTLGKRRNVFPYDQHITLAPFKNQQKF